MKKKPHPSYGPLCRTCNEYLKPGVHEVDHWKTLAHRKLEQRRERELKAEEERMLHEPVVLTEEQERHISESEAEGYRLYIRQEIRTFLIEGEFSAQDLLKYCIDEEITAAEIAPILTEVRRDLKEVEKVLTVAESIIAEGGMKDERAC